MANSDHVYNTASTLRANAFTLAGWTFQGWNTAAAGTGTAAINRPKITKDTRNLRIVPSVRGKFQSSPDNHTSHRTSFDARFALCTLFGVNQRNAADDMNCVKLAHLGTSAASDAGFFACAPGDTRVLTVLTQNGCFFMGRKKLNRMPRTCILAHRASGTLALVNLRDAVFDHQRAKLARGDAIAKSNASVRAFFRTAGHLRGKQTTRESFVCIAHFGSPPLALTKHARHVGGGDIVRLSAHERSYMSDNLPATRYACDRLRVAAYDCGGKTLAARMAARAAVCARQRADDRLLKLAPLNGKYAARNRQDSAEYGSDSSQNHNCVDNRQEAHNASHLSI
jgi:hypothetical protein